MFAKHLPPSAGQPRVLALDDNAASELPAEIELASARDNPVGEFDAIVGYAPPDNFAAHFQRLRPGGRLILAHIAPAEELLKSITTAGFIHCLVESYDALTLYRGERPPLGSSIERLQALNLHTSTPPHFIFLLITQTPNKPMWTLAVAPDEKLAWRAATVLDPATNQPTLLAFSSLVKAVAFMQSAILNQWLSGINKVGKFRADLVQTWSWPLVLNPEFESARALKIGPAYEVDSQTAVTGEE